MGAQTSRLRRGVAILLSSSTWTLRSASSWPEYISVTRLGLRDIYACLSSGLPDLEPVRPSRSARRCLAARSGYRRIAFRRISPGSGAYAGICWSIPAMKIRIAGETGGAGQSPAEVFVGAAGLGILRASGYGSHRH